MHGCTETFRYVKQLGFSVKDILIGVLTYALSQYRRLKQHQNSNFCNAATPLSCIVHLHVH